MRGTPSDRGLTLLEITMSTAILAACAAMYAGSVVAGQRSASEAAARQASAASGQSALSFMRPDLAMTGGSQVTIGPSAEGTAGNANQEIRFFRATSYDTTTKRTTWAPTSITYWYDAAGRRVLRRDDGSGRVRVLGADVEPGFGFRLDGRVLEVTIQTSRETWDGRRVYYPEPVTRPASGAPPAAVERVALLN